MMNLLKIDYIALRDKIVDKCSKCSGRGRKLVALDSDTLELQDCSCLTKVREIVPLYVAGIPRKYHHLKLDDFFDKKNRAYVRILKLSERLDELCDTGIGVYLNGGNGVGKTYLAACLLKLAIKKYGLKGVFIPMSLLVKLSMESLYDDGVRDWLDDLIQMDLIVLDEIEKVHISSKGREFAIINTIVSNLYNHEVSLIVTANCSKKGLSNRFGRAVADRFDEMLIEVPFTNQSFRKSVLEAKMRKAGVEEC